MLVAVRPVCEVHSTVSAGVRARARVLILVGFQVVLVPEGLVAVLALEGHLVCVYDGVVDHLVLQAEATVAHFAAEWFLAFVRQDVVLQLQQRFKRLLADLADFRLGLLVDDVV